MQRTTRFSGADWASELKEIMIIGVGGIGSWLSLSLSRIGHTLYLIDPDNVDETNVNGGQLYRTKDIGKRKVHAVAEICREFGCINGITCLEEKYNPELHGTMDIMITGLDNMSARKEVFNAWLGGVTDANDLLMDGRLLMETAEIFTLKGDDGASIENYREEWLFDDSEVEELECTTKQSTFAAMTIAGNMTATLCNWLTNRKLGMEFREVPYHQKIYFPIFDYKKQLYAKETITAL